MHRMADLAVTQFVKAETSHRPTLSPSSFWKSIWFRAISSLAVEKSPGVSWPESLVKHPHGITWLMVPNNYVVSSPMKNHGFWRCLIGTLQPDLGPITWWFLNVSDGFLSPAAPKWPEQYASFPAPAMGKSSRNGGSSIAMFDRMVLILLYKIST